jgi:hypothetical protein
LPSHPQTGETSVQLAEAARHVPGRVPLPQICGSYAQYSPLAHGATGEHVRGPADLDRHPPAAAAIARHAAAKRRDGVTCGARACVREQSRPERRK